jgi:hypothetical protein
MQAEEVRLPLELDFPVVVTPENLPLKAMHMLVRREPWSTQAVGKGVHWFTRKFTDELVLAVCGKRDGFHTENG